MDVCPISFVTRVPLQPNPEFVSGTWTDAAGKIQCDILFDAVMDQGVTPANASWELEINSTPRAVESSVWLSASVLRVTSVSGAVGLDPVTLELIVEDSNLHALGGNNVLPFGPETIPEL